MEVGPAEEVIRRPKHPYTQALIDALPKFGQCEGVGKYDTLLSADREVTDTLGCPFFIRCKRAHPERCRTEAPVLKAHGPSSLVACFYAESSEESGTGVGECRYGI